MKSFKFKWDETKTVVRNARQQLARASRRYFNAGRATFGTPATPAQLHAFRLQTKRFRYTLELFRPVYGPTLETMIGSLRRFQQLLGDVNDCETSRGLALKDGGRRSLVVRRLLRALDQRQAARTAELRRVWAEFDREGACARWIRYLDTYAGRGRRKDHR